jgi:hypothetical protein
MPVEVEIGDLTKCIELPELPEIPSISLFGIELQGFLDLSAGMTSQCTVNANLMAQLTPLLGSMSIIFKILAVLKGLESAAKSAFLDAGDLIAALADLAGLFVQMTPAGIGVTVVGALRLVISFLNCFVIQLQAVIDAQARIAAVQAQLNAGIDLPSPVVQASLDCASANVDLYLEHTMASLGPMEPLIALVSTLAGLVGISFEISLDVGAVDDLQDVVATMQETISSIEEVIESIPV